MWTNYSIFAPQQEPIVKPVNCDMEDLQFEDPNKVFLETQEETPMDKFNKWIMRCVFRNRPEMEEREEMYEM